MNPVKPTDSDALIQSIEKIETLEQKAKDLGCFLETTRLHVLSQSDQKIEALEQRARDLADFVETLRSQAHLQSEEKIKALVEKAGDLAHFVETVRKETRLQFETEIGTMVQKAQDLAASVEALRETALLESNSTLARLGHSHDAAVAMNEALLLGSIRQHELTAAADHLNAQLCSEIAGRRQAEGVLRASEQKLDIGMRVAGLALTNIDYTTGIKHLSKEAARQFGLGNSAVSLPREQVHKIIHADDVTELTQRIAESKDPMGDGWFAMDYRVVWPTGEVRWLRVREQVFFAGESGDRQPKRAILATLDITAEKLVEERLRLFEKVVTKMNDVVVITEAEPSNEPGPRILYVNPAFTTMTGYTAEEAIGKTPRILQGPKSSRVELEKVRAAMEQWQPVKVEVTDYRKDGTEFDVEFEIFPVADSKGSFTHWVSVQRDVTDRKRAEETLRQNAALFSTLIAQAPMGTYVVDPQFRMQQINAEAVPAFASVQPLIGRDFAEVLTLLWGPELGGQIAGIFRHTLETGERYISPPFTELRHDLGAKETYEWEIQRVTLPDGQHGVVCYFREVTERQRSLEALRAGQVRMHLATEATGVGIWEWNVISNLIRWDAQMFRLYGVPPTEGGIVPYETWSNAVLPEDLPEQERVLQDTLRRQGQSTREFRITRANDGQVRIIKAVETVRANLEGKTEWVVGSNLDVTERRQAAQKLSEAKEAAESANRSKDRFLAVLSHELRTPLAPVLMTVCALEHDKGLRPDVRDEMTMIRRNIEMETKLIDDLLDVSRIASGKLELRLEQLDINSAVQHVCSICRPQIIGQEVQLTFDLCDEAGFIHADPARFEQVLWNVLKNAVKFTPRNGKIHITSKRVSPTCVEVRITDNGAGISPEILPRIFDAFEQGDARITRQFGGLGLGLAISKALIELHGGTIRAESPGPGKGATFIIQVPGTLLQEPAHNQPAAPEPAKSSPLRLLIVEDHADTRSALKTLLTLEGFTVTTADDVATALKLAQTETFDILISDLGLPDASGYDLMAQMQDIQPLRGIAMSGYGMEEDIRESLTAGFSEHLVKPLKLPQLLAAIQRLSVAGVSSRGDRQRFLEGDF